MALRMVLVVALVAGAPGCVLTLRAQSADTGGRAFSRAHAVKVASNPNGLSLKIETYSGATTFALGELITLILEFSDQDGTRYAFDDRAYDRSGRLGIDRVHAAPSMLVEDPLRDYYRAVGFGIIGGGISGVPAPLTGPRVLSLDVNESLRFTRPGTYVLYVESHRFADLQEAWPRSHPAPLTSNAITLTVTPRRGGPEPLAGLSARALRYADTPEAAIELHTVYSRRRTMGHASAATRSM